MPLDYTIKAGEITRPKSTKWKKHDFGLEVEQNEKDGHFYITKVDGLVKKFTDFQVGDRLHQFQYKDATSEWTLEEIRATLQDSLTISIQAKHFYQSSSPKTKKSKGKKSKGLANKSSKIGSQCKKDSRENIENAKIAQFMDESDHTVTTVPLGNDSSSSLSWMNDSTASFAYDHNQDTLEEDPVVSEKAEENDDYGQKTLEEDLEVLEEEEGEIKDDQKLLQEDPVVLETEEEEKDDQKLLQEDSVVLETEEEQEQSVTGGQDQNDNDDGNDETEEELWKKSWVSKTLASVDDNKAGKTNRRTWVSRFPVSDKNWMLKQGNFNILDSNSKDVPKTSLNETDVNSKKIRTQVLLDTRSGVKHLAKQYEALAMS